jgi:beta-lactamase regulating signal transducer with metallopeptidase domain
MSMGEVNVSQPAMLASIAGHDSAPTGGSILLVPTVIYLVSGFYVAVALFFSLRLCWVLGCTSTLIRKATPASIGDDYVAMWNMSKERLSVRAASLMCSRDVPGPVTAGIWRPVLLLPATFIEEHSRTEFLAAVGHECAHIRRNDFLKNVCYEIAGLLTAFHPMTWFIKSRIAHTREMVCDRIAAEELLDRRTYGESLLQLATRMATVHSAVFHTMGMFDADFLERRIMTLMNSQTPVSRMRRYLAGAAAILLLGIAASVTGSFTQSVAAQTSQSSVRTDKKLEASKDLSCTYYEKGIGSPGTCGFDNQDQTKYRCYSNQDSTKSNPQIACEWKVQRALGAKRK